MMQNLRKDTIFTNFIYSVELLTPAEEVHAACLLLKDTYNTTANSNRNGWQSPGFGSTAPSVIFESLKAEVIQFANKIADTEQLGFSFKVANWWANVSKSDAYNVVHSHPGTDLVVVYYAKATDKSGELVLIRNDSSLSSNLFNNRPYETRFPLKPQAGRAYAFPAWLLHYVELSQDDEERVSVSFNLCEAGGLN
jgi:uncharacterized protein (TIGR02466 family)